MEWKTFIVEIIKAISWPASMLVGIWLLRKPLFDLIPLLRKLKYKGLSLEFSKEVKEAKQEAEQAIPVSNQQKSAIEKATKKYLQLLDVSPRAAILETWIELETAMINNIRRHELVNKSEFLRGHSRLGHVLLEEGIINKAQFDLFHKLRELRNRAAHAEDFELPRKDAADFIDSALLLSEHLRSN